ncbi:MAG: 1-(5-phosphoribosyl)-5-[(5-phosphoribosylamino)methylideneamino]imidazole-4-carboxamide isomerase [Kiritimatiellae bacterium]|nr:1-(5-phosphoribosyl)-5-[(5-phosphoribosylamino)methylideneamino]imidazole-4-carboxamide isomerase [Kiritimatiellia bacterium]
MTPFTIIPAIDLKGGKCVRLCQGRAEDVTVYGEDPVAMALHWQDEGAEFLHIVDLDGAFEGRPVHADLVVRMAAAVNIPVEIGGGLRKDEHVRRYLELGVARAVVGTRAWSDPDHLRGMVEAFGPALAVGIDARGDRVQVKGWTETTGMDALELAQRVDALGVQTLVFTDTARDGMLTGTNVRSVGTLCEAVSCRVIASGGVTSAADVKALKALGRPNLTGAIVGKALYEGAVTLKALMEA